MNAGAVAQWESDCIGNPFIWCLVDERAPVENRSFRLHGTGHELEQLPFGPYIGTFQLYGGSLVFHLFENH